MNKISARITSFIMMLMLIASIGSFAVPALIAFAEPKPAAVLDITQIVETEAEYQHPSDFVFKYKLSAESDNCPMPDDADGRIWNFDLNGNSIQKLQFIAGNGEAQEGVTAIRFYDSGLYHYTLSQDIKSAVVNVDYDKRIYDIKVQVIWKYGVPEFKAVWIERETGEKPASIDFKNKVHRAKVIGDPPVRVVKRIEGDTPTKDDKFTFVMTPKQEDFPLPYGAKGEYETYLYGEGEIEIGNIEFDAPGLYEYRVWERANPDLSYSYDKTVFTVRYDIKQRNDGSMTCDRTITMEDSAETECAFTNIYNDPKVPIKGDPDKGESITTIIKGRVKTGDASRAEAYVSLLVIAFAILLAMSAKKKHALHAKSNGLFARRE